MILRSFRDSELGERYVAALSHGGKDLQQELNKLVIEYASLADAGDPQDRLTYACACYHAGSKAKAFDLLAELSESEHLAVGPIARVLSRAWRR